MTSFDRCLTTFGPLFDPGDATRLTYAVEIQPKGLLPVRLIEGRIASDLRANLAAIRWAI